jgi:hypothetical protein
MTVTRRQIMNEIAMELDKTKLDHTEDNFADICDQVVSEWKSNARIYLDRGYSTGEYRNSIHRESVRATRANGGNLGGWKSRAVTYDEIAHLLEYGTGPDQEGVGSWFSIKDNRWHRTPNTPTPAFGLAAEVENSFNSTWPKTSGVKGGPYAAINRGNRPTNQELFADWEADNPEAAERYSNNRTSASITRSWLRYSDQNPT